MNLRKLKRYVALKIKFDPITGWRAGEIDVRRDTGLFAIAQNISRGEEIRLVLDDRDVEQYKNVEGIEVIEGIEAIDAAIDEVLPPEEQEYYDVLVPEAVTASMIALHLDPKQSFDIIKIPGEEELDTNPIKARSKFLKVLKDHGVKGIVKRKRIKKLSEIISSNYY